MIFKGQNQGPSLETKRILKNERKENAPGLGRRKRNEVAHGNEKTRNGISVIEIENIRGKLFLSFFLLSAIVKATRFYNHWLSNTTRV